MQAAPARSIRALLPRLHGTTTDADRRRFAKGAFAAIRKIFDDNLKQVTEENGRIDFDITDATATDFRAELYLDGASKGQCRVWLGGMMGENNICFAEGRMTGDAYNQILAPASDGELVLSAMLTMGFSMGFSEFEKGVDMKRLSPEQAAGYLWERFTARPRAWPESFDSRPTPIRNNWRSHAVSGHERRLGPAEFDLGEGRGTIQEDF